jgi:excisionase family DNA binding protein
MASTVPPGFCGTTEVAALLDISVDTLGKLMRQGQIAYRLNGTHRLIELADIDR